MAHSKSARKRVRQALKAQLRNRRRKASVKRVVREFDEAVRANQPDKAAEQLKAAYKRIDQVSAKGTIHKNAAARRKSRLAKRLAKLQQAAPSA